MLLIICLLLVFFVYVFMSMPSLRSVDSSNFINIDYAHRGLHDNNSEAKENTLLAIKQAVDASFGIEFDIRLSKDGQIVLFHDDCLKRMTGLNKKVRDLTYKELKEINFINSNQKIPLFSEVLELVNGKVPLIIELKCDLSDVNELSSKTSEMLDYYKGDFMVESFNPKAVQWFKKYRPNYIRGQLSSGHFKNLNFFESFLMSHLLFNFLSRPDFIAYEHKYSNNLSLWIQKYIYKKLMVCYTIKNKKDYEKNKSFFDLIIFEDFNK